MSWFMVGSAVVTTAATAYSGNQAAKSQAAAVGRQSKMENEAIERANIKNTIRMHYRAGLLNMQLGLQKKQAAQKGFDIVSTGKQALAQSDANAAAAGSIGSSVDAVSNDIQQKIGEAQIQQAEEWEMNLTNFNTDLEALATGAEDTIQYERKFAYDGPSGNQILLGAIGAGVSQFASAYGQRKLSLGLGEQAAPKSVWLNQWGGM